MKRIIITLITVCLLLVNCSELVYAAAPTISLPSSEHAKIVGFTQKRTITAKYDLGVKLDNETISSTQVVGYCHVYAGKYRANRKYDGKYYDAMLIKCVMEPWSFKSDKGRIFYGFSEKLNLCSTLGQYVTYQGNSPTNATTGSTSYTFGISGGYKEAAVSGSVTQTFDYCSITDKSSISNNSFDVIYDYKSWVLDFSCNSERNKMLFEQTWQCATCEWTTAQSTHAKYLKIDVDFGISRDRHAGLGKPFGHIVSQPAGYNLNYSNDM